MKHKNSFHIVRRFSGIKFVPPGLHLIAWSTTSPSPSSSSSASVSMAGPSNVPIRHAVLRYFNPKQRVVLHFDRSTESVMESGSGSANTNANASENVISDDHLRTLDKEMAPYPFSGLESWKALTEYITPDVLESVLGAHTDGDGLVDGMTSVEGEEEDSDSKEMKNEVSTLSKNQPPLQPRSQFQPQSEGLGQEQDHRAAAKKLKFVRFGLKRSWRDGAIGEEVTRFSRDKSWLLGDVLSNQLAGDLNKLLGQFQLSFILLLHLSSYSALLVYKRLLTLLCQSPSFLSYPSAYLSTSPHNNNKKRTNHTKTAEVRRTYASLLGVLGKQIEAIPDGSFDTELPELDAFFQDQIESLRLNISASIQNQNPPRGSAASTAASALEAGWSEAEKEAIKTAWCKLEKSAKKWGWEIGTLALLRRGGDDDESSEEEEEEGEYAPVIVNL
ncbi:hypothetical protein I316_05364 [Kwoniella heveanensis BCC8398]|uniref:A1 cistron-splicing factor AAR2 n=1 Tax=Kwoniella heveanensis BCC8398 TaxID=1296120 RepID=A0A1B9GPU4_9TREE|nr:hypothetical protein I316_05364 [Kwoniella heveanensis BCC8398]